MTKYKARGLGRVKDPEGTTTPRSRNYEARNVAAMVSKRALKKRENTSDGRGLPLFCKCIFAQQYSPASIGKRGAGPKERTPQRARATNGRTPQIHRRTRRFTCVFSKFETLQPSSANAGERGASPNEGWRVPANEIQAPNIKTPSNIGAFRSAD